MLKPFEYISSPVARFFAEDKSTTTDATSSRSGRSQATAADQDVTADRAGVDGSTNKVNGKSQDSVTISREAEEIRQMQDRDREVRAHEAAHAAAGGAYAGSPTYTTEQGPDGVTYATGGEVSIDISPVKGDPQATLQKAEQVRSAALAPAQPSAQDMKVAQRAQSMAAKARMDIAEENSEQLNRAAVREDSPQDKSDVPQSTPSEQSINSSTISGSDFSGTARLSIYS